MTVVYLKVFVGLILLGLWVWLSIVPYPNTGAIISFIQLTLGGLAHNLTTTPLPTVPPAQVQVAAATAPVTQPTP